MKTSDSVIVPVIQCNHVDFEGATDVSLRTAPDGRFVIERVIENAKALSANAFPVIACPNSRENLVFREIANKYEIQCYMGNDLNVAERLIGAATIAGGSHIAWLQGLLYFLDVSLMDSLVNFSIVNNYDYVRCIDGSCKHWLGQFLSVDALRCVLSSVESLEPNLQTHFRARPFAFMRANPELFRVGLFEDLPSYSNERLLEMRRIARLIHVGGERAEHTQKGSTIGDVSIGRYKEIIALIREGSDVLDIACGNGYGAHLIAQTGSRVTGVDVNEGAICNANAQYGNSVNFKIGDGTRIPLDDACVDTVVSIGTIEHVVDDRKFVSEINRVLRKSGSAIIYTPQNRLGSIPTWPWHEREYSIEQLVELFHSGGFNVKHVWGWQNGVVTRDDSCGDGTYLIAEKP